MDNSWVNKIGKLTWSEATQVKQLCELRQAQLRAIEKCVYVVRRGQTYLAYRRGNEEVWTDLKDMDLAVYPSFEVAEYVRGHFTGSSVVKIPKTELVTLPAMGPLLGGGCVDSDGNFIG